MTRYLWFCFFSVCFISIAFCQEDKVSKRNARELANASSNEISTKSKKENIAQLSIASKVELVDTAKEVIESSPKLGNMEKNKKAEE